MSANVTVIPGNTIMTAETMEVVGRIMADMLMAGILGEGSGESDTLKIGSRCRLAG